MKRHFWIIATFLFLVVSCDKEEANEADILTSKTWKVGFIDKNPQSNTLEKITYYPRLECEKDDIYTFTDRGQLIIQKGGDKCLSTEASKEILSYSIDIDKKELSIGDQTYTIAEISKSQIKYYLHIPPAAADYNIIVYLLQ